MNSHGNSCEMEEMIYWQSKNAAMNLLGE
uniref:Uncharacterized protein n=1 Tax=Rhizophora mucronata TaxID=61149 RepID=A0A2P2Q6G1_RHIMU